MMSYQTIQISSKCSRMESRFGPREIVVYQVPTINDCLALLPRHLGNYILSFTHAWLEYYLDNLVDKYGQTFVNSVLEYKIFGNVVFKRRGKQNNHEFYSTLLKHIKENNTSRNLIHQKFTQAIEQKMIDIAIENERKLKLKLKKEIDLQRLSVGDIYHAGWSCLFTQRELYLVIQKTPKSYYSLAVLIESETETSYTLKLTYCSANANIRNYIVYNRPIREVAEPIKPPKQIIIKNKTFGYNEAIFTNKTKKEYFIGLFGF